MIGDILRFRRKMVRVGLPALVSRGMLVFWGFFTILIIRILPEETYAAYAIGRGIQIFAEMFGGNFIMNSIVKYFSEGEGDREKRLANAGMVLSMGVAVLVAAVLVFGGGQIRSFYSGTDLTGVPLALAVLVITSTARTSINVKPIWLRSIKRNLRIIIGLPYNFPVW